MHYGTLRGSDKQLVPLRILLRSLGEKYEYNEICGRF